MFGLNVDWTGWIVVDRRLELQNIEQLMNTVSNSLEEGFRDHDSREELGRLLSRRKDILIAREIEWRLKSHVI